MWNGAYLDRLREYKIRKHPLRGVGDEHVGVSIHELQNACRAPHLVSSLPQTTPGLSPRLSSFVFEIRVSASGTPGPAHLGARWTLVPTSHGAFLMCHVTGILSHIASLSPTEHV